MTPTDLRQNPGAVKRVGLLLKLRSCIDARTEKPEKLAKIASSVETWASSELLLDLKVEKTHHEVIHAVIIGLIPVD
jgi:hypothetical protein